MKLISEIKSKAGDLHFRRWLLLSLPWFDVCIHQILRRDEDKHEHNHPWWFFSLILWGGYVESREGKIIRRGWLSPGKMGRDQYHQVIRLLGDSTWTLVLRSRFRDDKWGYNVSGEHVVHTEYRKLKNEGKL